MFIFLDLVYTVLGVEFGGVRVRQANAECN